MLSYNPGITDEILKKHQLITKNNKYFIDDVYRVLGEMFEYVPKLIKVHFFNTAIKYLQVKANMAGDANPATNQKNSIFC